MLIPKTGKGYLVGLLSLRLDYILDKAELEVYSLPVLQKNLAGIPKGYIGRQGVLVNVGQ